MTVPLTLQDRSLSQVGRVLVAILLLLALMGGAGVAAADSDDTSGSNCPEDNPTNAYDNTSDNAVDKSAEGRQEAIEGGECITKK